MGEDARDREHQHEKKLSGRQDHRGGDVAYGGWKEGLEMHYATSRLGLACG